MKALAALLLCAVATNASAQSVIANSSGRRPLTAIRNATIYPVTSEPIANGTILFADGVIRAIGTSVTIPADARIIDGTGLSVYPGLIDSGTAVGLTEIGSVRGTNDVTEFGDLNPNARAAVAVNPHSNVIPVTRVNGITTVVTRPQGSLISGQGALIRLAGWTPDEMVIKAPVAMYINFPQARVPSFSDTPQNAEAEKKSEKEYTDRLQKLRDTLRDARAYATAVRARARTTTESDPILEALVPVVNREVPVVITANRAADIRAALKFGDEEKLDVIISGGADVQRVIDDLRKRRTPVLLGPIYALPPREDDPYDVLFTNAAALLKAGVPFALQTGDAHDVRNLPYQAAACAAFGLPKDEALKAITIYPARIFGVDKQLGSLEVGKMANFFLADGDPLEIRTNIRQVFIDGEEIPMESFQTLLYRKFTERPAPAK